MCVRYQSCEILRRSFEDLLRFFPAVGGGASLVSCDEAFREFSVVGCVLRESFLLIFLF